jgi:hypothetical protein
VSDEDLPTDDGEYRRGKDKEPGDPVVSDPKPKDPALFTWLEELFYAEPEVTHCPEVIDCRVVTGKQMEKYGPLLRKVEFAPSLASDEALKKMPGKVRKPTRAQLVAIANDFTKRMRQDCDISKRQQTYGCHAWKSTTDDEPYSRYNKHLKPEGRYAKDDDHNAEDESMEERFGVQLLRHGERMTDLHGGAFEGLLDRMDRIIERQDGRIEKQDERIAKLVDMLERSLSLEEDRMERRMWTQLKIGAVQKGFDLGTALLPPLVNQIAGKQVLPTSDTAETITIKTFLGSVTEEQGEKAFGKVDDQRNIIQPGVLKREQADIIQKVALGQVSADELDRLIPPYGDTAISMEQVIELNKIFRADQIAPLMLIFQARIERIKKQRGE